MKEEITNSNIKPESLKQLSHTRTGYDHPRSGTGRLFIEHFLHTPFPHARQWCLVISGSNVCLQTAQFCKKENLLHIVLINLENYFLSRNLNLRIQLPVLWCNLISNPRRKISRWFGTDAGDCFRNIGDTIDDSLTWIL